MWRSSNCKTFLADTEKHSCHELRQSPESNPSPILKVRCRCIPCEADCSHLFHSSSYTLHIFVVLFCRQILPQWMSRTPLFNNLSCSCHSYNVPNTGWLFSSPRWRDSVAISFPRWCFSRGGDVVVPFSCMLQWQNCSGMFWRSSCPAFFCLVFFLYRQNLFCPAWFPHLPFQRCSWAAVGMPYRRFRPG